MTSQDFIFFELSRNAGGEVLPFLTFSLVSPETTGAGQARVSAIPFEGIRVKFEEALESVLDSFSGAGEAWLSLNRVVRHAAVTGLLMTLPMKSMAQEATDPMANPEAKGNTTVAVQSREKSVTTMPEVVVVGDSYKPENSSSVKYTQSLLDTPKSISVIPAKMMTDQGNTSLRESLQNVPGITQNAGENGNPSGDSFNIRGFSARNDTYHDGVRDLASYSRDTFNVDRVEIIQGPSSSTSGRGSTGGTIDVISKTPQKDAFFQTSLSLGTANEDFAGGVRRATADVNQPLTVPGLENAGFRLNVMQQHSGVAGRKVIENKGWGIAPSFSFGLGTDTKLTFGYYSLRQDNTPDYGIPAASGSSQNPPAAVDPSNYYGLKNRDKEKVEANNFLFKVEQDLSPEIHLRNQLSYGRSSTDRIVTTLETLSDANRKPKNHVLMDDGINNKTDLTVDFETSGIKHNAVAGVEYIHEYSEFGKWGLQGTDAGVADPNNPNPYDQSAPVTGMTTNTLRVEDDTVGVYLLDTVKFDRNWQVTGGARFDYFQPHNIQQGLSIVSPLASQGMLSWNAALVYKPEKDYTFYASVADSFNPSIQGLSLDGSQSTNIGQLPPEESLSYEAGVKADLNEGRLSVTGAVFRTDKVNARMPNPDDPQSTVQIMGGKQRVEGAVVGVQGSPLEKLNLYASYTYLDGKILTGLSRATSVVAGPVTNVAFVDQAGWALANVPTHSANLWTTYETPFGLQVGAGLVYGGTRPIQTSPGAAVTTGVGTVIPPSSILQDYLVANAMLGYQFTKELGLQLNLYNLGDKVYFTQGRFWTEGTRRSGVLTANLKF